MRQAGFCPVLLPTLLLASAAHAQEPPPTPAPTPGADCLKLQEDAARLKCFDLALKFKPEKEPTAKKIPDIAWKVRDSGTITPIGDSDVGTKPGLFQVGVADGKNFSSAKVALMGVFKPIDSPKGFFDAWEPFVGVSWDRDTAAKTPKDLRQAFVGITGQIGTPGPRGTSLHPTFRAGYRDDTKAKTQGAFLTSHFDVIHLPWVFAKEVEGKNATAIVPFFGVHSAEARTSPVVATDGKYTGAYLGAKFETKLLAIAPRLSLTGKGQIYRDADTPGTVGNRTLRFGTLGLKYDLVDPKAKAGWVPSISLTHQRGTEPVTGEGPGHKTVLGFGVKYD